MSIIDATHKPLQTNYINRHPVPVLELGAFSKHAAKEMGQNSEIWHRPTVKLIKLLTGRHL